MALYSNAVVVVAAAVGVSQGNVLALIEMSALQSHHCNAGLLNGANTLEYIGESLSVEESVVEIAENDNTDAVVNCLYNPLASQ